MMGGGKRKADDELSSEMEKTNKVLYLVPMFWRFVDKVRYDGGDKSEWYDDARKEFLNLDKKTQNLFIEQFYSLRERLYNRYGHMDIGLGDDSFQTMMSWIIKNGENVYTDIIQNENKFLEFTKNNMYEYEIGEDFSNIFSRTNGR